MLMVIFGAGASYDSCPTYPPGSSAAGYGGDPLNKDYRPPLANELFENRPMFADAIQKFPECQPIVPRLRSLSGETLEAVLEDLQAKSIYYPRGVQQLAAVRYYLQFVIRECERGWRGVVKGVTNYKSLLNEIERGNTGKEQVCLVTFNYDTLLEDALSHFGLPIETIDDYTKKHPFYKLFKLHGSVNWARTVDTRTKAQNPEHAWSVAYDLIERAAEIPINQEYVLTEAHPPGAIRGIPVFPAIAIPVEKKKSFECPPGQLEELVALLPKVSQVLVIGWRASEAHFLAMLGNRLTGLTRGVQLYIVAGPRRKEGEEIQVRICRQLLNNPPSSAAVDAGGFTDFILSRRAEQFLRS
jgi:SIR2-like domain